MNNRVSVASRRVSLKDLFRIGMERRTYREVAFFWMNAVGLTLIIPFNINNFIQERYAVVAVGTAVALMILINIYSMYVYGRLLINTVYSTIPVMIAVWVITYRQGFAGGYWAYPALMWIYFSHNHRTATVFNVVFLSGLFPILFYTMEIQYSSRNAATILLTGLLANIFSRIVENQQSRLAELTITDPLTGVFNRRHMDELIPEALMEKRKTGTPYAMIVLDIDHFKKINDRYGHGTGDETIQKVAQICLSRIRSEDRIFRTGGEEFIILLHNATRAEAKAVAIDCKKLIEKSELIKKHRVTVSCGVSELMESDDVKSWLQRCDSALYRAKRTGRNRVVNF